MNGVPEPSEWMAVRQTKSYQGNQGISDVNSPDMRCFQMRPGRATAQVTAGTELGFVANAAVTHFGPMQFYMAKVPDGADINTWEPAGNVWFKVASISAQQGPGGLTSSATTWPAYRKPPYHSVNTCFISNPGDLSPLRLQRKRSSPSPFPRIFPTGSTWCAPSPLPCTRRRVRAVHRSTSAAARSR